MSKDITCTLPGERGEFWKGVLGTDTVCIVSPLSTVASLPDVGMQPVYMLDMDTLDADQKSRLAESLSSRFGVSPAETIELMEKHGVPILAEGCTVMVSGSPLGLLLPDYDPDEEDWEKYEDDSEDWRYDPNRCPACGDWLDAEGNCSDMECGWVAADDDDYDDDEPEAAQVPPDDFGDIPF